MTYWSEVEGSSNAHVGHVGLVSIHLEGKAKVGELGDVGEGWGAGCVGLCADNLRDGGEHDVLGFEVTMHDVRVVQMLDASGNVQCTSHNHCLQQKQTLLKYKSSSCVALCTHHGTRSDSVRIAWVE